MIEIIAEIGQNFNGDLELAVDLIHRAKDAGADVAKFQVFNARELFSKEGNPWYDYNLKTELSRDQVFTLAEECERVDIEFFASAFDPDRVGWLEEVDVSRHKVASRSVKDRELLKSLEDTGKPLIVSLGMWNGDSFPDIGKDQDVYFLYCISQYPTPLTEVEMANVDFSRYSGFSDHTTGLTASFAAMARGAKIIEKHFTMDREMYGPDHACSMNPAELKQLCRWRDELLECM